MDILKKVIIPTEINGHKVTKICDGAFRDSQISLIEFEAPDNIKSIGMGAFYNSSLEKIDIPNVKYIFTNTFENCTNLSEVNIPQSVIKIKKFAFNNCGLINVVIPEGVKDIESYVFNSCSYLKNVTIPESVNQIGDLAFAKTALESIKIPASVNKIDNYVFFNCNNLIEVTFRAINLKNYCNNIFFCCQNHLKIYVPSESVDFYSNWLSQYSDITIYEINNEEG